MLLLTMLMGIFDTLPTVIAERIAGANWGVAPGTTTRHAVIDDLLPPDLAQAIHAAFPVHGQSFKRRISFRERKETSAKLDELDPLLKQISIAIQDPLVVAAVARLSGIDDIEADASLYAGGLSMMRQGDFLNPHIDNSHDAVRSRYRRINLLYYATPEWRLENGGNLELWDSKVRKPVPLVSVFNRLVLMETDRNSWHSVSPVTAASVRCCVSSYYFSKASPAETEYFHVTRFSARPEQPVRRLYAGIDAAARNFAGSALGLGRGRSEAYKIDG